MKKQAQQEAEHFEGPVLEYGRMTTALKTALHKRNEKKITYMTAAHDLEAKRAYHSKVAGMGGDRQVRKVYRGRRATAGRGRVCSRFMLTPPIVYWCFAPGGGIAQGCSDDSYYCRPVC